MAGKQMADPDRTENQDECTTPDNTKLSNDLLEAVEYDDEEKAIQLIQDGADVNITSTMAPVLVHTVGPDGKEGITRIETCFPGNYLVDKEGKTALYFAVENKNENVVRALIDAGADVNIVDRKSKIPLLICAFKSRNEGIIDAIIKAGANLKVSDTNGKSALSYALENNMEDIAKTFLDAGVGVNVTDGGGKTALFYVHCCGAVLSSVIEAASDVNVRDNERKTALFYAVQRRDNEGVVRALIAAGADANLTDDEGKTALFYAVQQSKNENVVRKLVEEGKALVNIRDYLGRTPLFYAIARSTDAARYLLDKGSSLYTKDYHNMCIFSFAYENCLKIEQQQKEKKQELQRYTAFRSFDASEVYDVIRQIGIWTSENVDFTLVHKFFIDNGVERSVELSSIVNTVFCIILSKPGTFEYFPLIPFTSELPTLSKILELAKHKRNKGPGGKNSIIENILVEVRKEFRGNNDLYKTIASNILPELIKLGADPNSADSDGNTALHYATRLPFYDVSREMVMSICTQLTEYGAVTNVRNHRNETPLLFCLSKEIWMDLEQEKHLAFSILIQVCMFLLGQGSSVEDTTKQGETVFHLILALIQQLLRWTPLTLLQWCMNDVMVLLKSSSDACMTRSVTINMRDIHLNSPLHLWATLRFDFYEDDVYKYVNELFIATLLGPVLKLFLELGAKLNDRNENEETPLHLCKTWSAVKLLLDAEANPNVVDSLGRPPLLTAAKGRTFMRNTGQFYPDNFQQPQEFWGTALENGLDFWTVDNNGESVLSILTESGSFALAGGMVEAAREKGYLESDKVAIPLLKAICKDKSTRRHDKGLLLKNILKSRKKPFSFKNYENSPLHACCRNIVEATSRDKFVNDIKSTALWELAELLLWYGADCRILDATGQSCLDIAEECQPLKDLLLSPVDVNEVPFLISHWNSVSSKYEYLLAKVARGREFKYLDPFWYHQDHLASGSFGNVFAGINEKDGREVAIKRIEKIRMQRPEDKREITSLITLAECKQVVRYLSFFEDENFSYVVLELMEGNLDDYLDGPYFDKNQELQLSNNVMSGLSHLHGENILHRDLKPSNILYKCHPKLCLKIADFGLSRRIDSTSTTVYGTNAGTRCWIAPEVVNSAKDHSKSSDVFACGLILHYILSVKKHPFAPVDCAKKGAMQINHETEANILNGNMEGWDNSLHPEAVHLLANLLDKDENKRLTSEAVLAHPMYWSKTKKVDLLTAVGNQPEFEYPRAGRSVVLSAVETDLEAQFGTIVKYVDWNDPRYAHMPDIYKEMEKKRKYDTHSVVELVRLIRNAFAHISESTRPTAIRKQLLEDFVFLEYFPNLVMEVYKAVTTHGWDQTRDEIKYAMKK